MNGRLSELYFSFKEIPDVIVFMVLFFKTIFQKTDVKYKKNTSEVVSILGNGPSANLTYLESNEIDDKLMCVNYFALTKEFLLYKPEYYTLIDPEFFLAKNDKNNALIDLMNCVSWKMQLFIPFRYKNIFRGAIKNKNIDIKCFRINYLPGKSKFVYNLYLRNLATPKFQNIIVACLYIALNKGSRRIKLHGVEASEFTNFKVNENNEVLLEAQHSYGNTIRNMSKEGRIKQGEFWKYLNYYSLMFKGFSQVASYSKYMDSKIYNYTKNSYIDSFEKK